MKKIVVFALIFSMAFSLFAIDLTSSRGRGVTAAILPVNTEGKTFNASDSWIPDVVLSGLTDGFSRYTNMTLIDKANVKKRLAEIKKSNSAFYDEKEGLELGKNLNAKVIVIPTVTPKRSNYLFDVQIIEVETGNLIANSSKDFTSAEFNNRRAIDQTIYTLLFEKLQYVPTPTEKNALLHIGEKESFEELERQARAVEKEIADAEKQFELEMKRRQAEFSEEDIAQKREAQNATIARMKANAESLRNKAEQQRIEAEKIKRDAEIQAKMSKDQKAKLQQMEMTAKKRQAELSLAKSSEYTSIELVRLNENQKSALNTIVDDTLAAVLARIDDNQKVFEQQAAGVRKQLRNKEKNPSFYDDDGKFNQSGIDAENAEIAILEADRNAKNEKDKKDIIKSTESNENSILKNIKSNEDSFKKIPYVERSILSENIVLQFSEYVGSMESWKVDISFYFNGNLVWTKKDVVIGYKALTGLNPVQYNPNNKTEFENFQNDIKLYDSLFRQNMPVIDVRVKYTVLPVNVTSSPKVIRSKVNPNAFEFVFPQDDSCYNVTVTEFEILNTNKDKVFYSEKVGVTKKIDCSNPEKRHKWNSAQAWEILDSGSKKIISKEESQKKKAEQKRKRKEKTDEIKTKISATKDSAAEGIENYKSNFSMMQLDYPAKEGWDFMVTPWFKNGFNGFTAGAALHHNFFKDYDNIGFAFKADLGGMKASWDGKYDFYIDIIAEAEAHCVLAKRFAPFIKVGLGTAQIVCPLFELGVGAYFMVNDEWSVLVDYALNANTFPVHGVTHGPSFGVHYNGLKSFFN